MKKLILFFVFITALSCVKNETSFSTDSKKAFLIITKNTTKDELTKISSEFKLIRNIDIDFSKTTFQNNGKVENVTLEVNCNDGFKGTVKTISSVFSLNNCGFQRDYTKNAKKPWSIGSM